MKAKHYQTSAKLNKGIQELFLDLAKSKSIKKVPIGYLCIVVTCIRFQECWRHSLVVVAVVVVIQWVLLVHHNHKVGEEDK